MWSQTATARKQPKLSEKFAGITLYADLSAFTIQPRCPILTIMNALCNHNIKYQWDHPTNLTFTTQGTTNMVYSLDKGLQLSSRLIMELL